MTAGITARECPGSGRQAWPGRGVCPVCKGEPMLRTEPNGRIVLAPAPREEGAAMMMDEQQTKAKALRAPFTGNQIGKLPKPYRANSEKGNCPECGQYHGLPAMHLDYVGHAAVTDRLLQVDPTWTWEPLAVDEVGLPVYDRSGGLWIKLTVAGVTRLGYGDGPDPKQRIGDALRNAAMRFGVALDLWNKDGPLYDDYAEPASNAQPEQATAGGSPKPDPTPEPSPSPPPDGVTADDYRNQLLDAAHRREVVGIMRTFTMAGLADSEVADDKGVVVTLSELATRRMREVETG